MATSRLTVEAGQPPLRRRGAVLERAILDAALDQLNTVGFNGLTMEGVAAGAQTGKAAVYRRWPSKEDLVADALRAALPSLAHAPDLGSVREDLFELCRTLREAMYSRPGTALRSVLHECDQAEAERFHELITEGVMRPTEERIKEVVRRGIKRGEVRPGADHTFVYEVIPAMMMYRAKVCGSEWADPDFEQMVDRVMLPLLLAPAP
ncbi:TetR/AcrR family transcriptional regulator [Streptomyces sp. NPDC050560]|uniref:TetR/AcrR family transcriptional regulator n=1 Tax=Streptomyces sp. NPDC050560 TaxID=3365630 RepID=UPI0037A5CBB1